MTISFWSRVGWDGKRYAGSVSRESTRAYSVRNSENSLSDIPVLPGLVLMSWGRTVALSMSFQSAWRYSWRMNSVISPSFFFLLPSASMASRAVSVITKFCCSVRGTSMESRVSSSMAAFCRSAFPVSVTASRRFRIALDRSSERLCV